MKSVFKGKREQSCPLEQPSSNLSEIRLIEADFTKCVLTQCKVGGQLYFCTCPDENSSAPTEFIFKDLSGITQQIKNQYSNLLKSWIKSWVPLRRVRWWLTGYDFQPSHPTWQQNFNHICSLQNAVLWGKIATPIGSFSVTKTTRLRQDCFNQAGQQLANNNLLELWKRKLNHGANIQFLSWMKRYTLIFQLNVYLMFQHVACLKNDYATATFCFTLLLIKPQITWGNSMSLFVNEENYTRSKIITKLCIFHNSCFPVPCPMTDLPHRITSFSAWFSLILFSVCRVCVYCCRKVYG